MVSIGLATKTDIPAIIQITREVFDMHVAPDYSSEGNEEFNKYLTLEAFEKRLAENHFILLAYLEEKLTGLIEIRNNNHVSLLFVESEHQQKGIGRALLNEALKRIKENNPDCKEISVNSSPNAVTAYEKLGFHQTNAEKITNGIRYVPMEMRVS